MNVALIERVRAHILEEPRRVRMEVWVASLFMDRDDKLEVRPALADIYAFEHGGREPQGVRFDRLVEFPPCGAVACLAAWGVILSQPDPEAALRDSRFLYELHNLWQPQAATLFGMTTRESDKLFWVSEWPVGFAFRYEEAADAASRARAVADYMSFFVTVHQRRKKAS